MREIEMHGMVMRVFLEPQLLLRYRLAGFDQRLSGATEQPLILGCGSLPFIVAKAHRFAIFMVAIMPVQAILFFRIIVPTHLPSAPLVQFQPTVAQSPLAAPVRFQPAVAQPSLAAAVLSIPRSPEAVMSAQSSADRTASITVRLP